MKQIKTVSTDSDWLRVVLNSGEYFNIHFDNDETSFYVGAVPAGKTIKCQKQCSDKVVVLVVTKE